MTVIARNKQYLAAGLLFCFISAFLPAADTYVDFDIHTNIMHLTEAIPPKMVGRTLFMTYASESPVRYVGVSFAHESYRTVHPYTFITTETGKRIFYITIPLSDAAMELKYRIVVDGLWIADPSNPRKSIDSLGMEYSLYAVAANTRRISESPLFSQNRVDFHYYDSPGKRVYVSGDFNNWDPYVHRLKESSPGVYHLSLRMREGTHYYYYIVNGERILDPMNDNYGSDPNELSASYFTYDGN